MTPFAWDWRKDIIGPLTQQFGGLTTPVANPIVSPGQRVPEMLIPMKTGVTPVPDERTVVPPVPPAVPATTAAPVAAPPTDFETRALEALKNGDFGSALAALAKGFGASKGPPVPQAFRVSGFQRMSPGKNLEGAGSAMMKGALEKLEPTDLRIPIKRRLGERENYDILKRRRRGDD